MKVTRNDVLFWLGILFALWFMLTGMVWVYFAALFVGYPFGLISFLFWRSIKKDGKKRNQVIPVLLLVGLAASLTALVFLLIWN